MSEERNIEELLKRIVRTSSGRLGVPSNIDVVHQIQFDGTSMAAPLADVCRNDKHKTRARTRMNPAAARPAMPSPAEQKRHRKAVADAFGESWLNDSSGKNPLQKLWTRNDHLANVEIQTIGLAFVNLARHHEQWLKGVAKEAKSGDGDKGKLFESVCLSMFEGVKGIKVIPASKGKQGYDAQVEVIAQNISFLLSIKNHDISRSELDFRHECRKLKDLQQRILTSLGISAQTLVTANDRYLLPSDWMRIANCLRNNIFGVPAHFELENGIYVDIMPLQRDPINQPLSTKVVSATMQIGARYSPKEQENFEQKIEDASRKFEKLAMAGSKTPRVGFIRLHSTAIFPRMVGYATQRMEAENLPFHLDALMLYQSTPIRDNKMNPYANSEVLHHIQTIDSKGFSLSKLSIPLSLPIGKVYSSYAYNMLYIAGKPFKLDQHYFYQAGDLYVDGVLPVASSVTCTVGSPVAGIRTHVVLADGSIMSPLGIADEEEFLVI